MERLAAWFKGFLAVFIIFVMPVHATEEVRYIRPFTQTNPEEDYYVQLLRLSLELSAKKFGPFTMKPQVMPMLQNRQILSLGKGEIDVLWSMTSRQRENQAQPVRIPLMRGLIGYRLLLIRESERAKFRAIDSVDKLKPLLGVQGEDWPDLSIMESNGLKVAGATDWQSIYHHVASGDYDYFPRGVLEIGAEVEHYVSEGLVVAPGIMLYYPTAMYFFVAKNNDKLARRIAYGLEQAIDNGDFNKLLINHPAHRLIFSELGLDSRTVLQLKNPYLPDTARTLDEVLWLQPQNLSEFLKLAQ